MRKTMKKVILPLILVTVMLLMTVPAYAADPAGTRGYTVTIYTGNRGTINGTGKYVVENVPYGTVLDLSAYSEMCTVQTTTTVTSSGSAMSTTSTTAASTAQKFDVKPGARRAGEDNNSAKQLVNAEITGDTDFVLTYYVPGEMKGYTVRYVDANGNNVAQPSYGSASVGDKLTVGSKDVDGYTPNAYNLAKTISVNEADNVFTFVYTPKAPVEPIVIELPGTNGNGNGNANGNGNVNVNIGQNGANNAAAGEGETAPAAPAAPAEIIDLDEQEVPLANLDAEGMKEKTKMDSRNKSLLFGGFALCLGLLAAILYIIFNKNDEEELY